MGKVIDPSFQAEDPDVVDAQLSRAIAEGRVAEAARTAIERQKAKGMGVTFLRGDTIVTQYPDGREEVLGTVASGSDWTPTHTLTTDEP